jgi:HSP20 family protein
VNHLLTINGRREESSKTNDAEFFRREIRYGDFERSIRLPKGIREEDLTAVYRDGVLELSGPIAPNNAAKKVTIQVEDTQHDPRKIE